MSHVNPCGVLYKPWRRACEQPLVNMESNKRIPCKQFRGAIPRPKIIDIRSLLPKNWPKTDSERTVKQIVFI